MNRRISLIVVALAVAAVAGGALAAARLAQPADPVAAVRGRCVSVTAYPHPTQSGTLLLVRVWEDGSVELYTRGPKPIERDEWVALP